MKTQMTLGKKLIAGFSLMLALALILSYSSLAALSGMKDRFDSTIARTVRKIELADDMNTAESDMLAFQRLMLLNSFAKDAAKVQTARQQWNAKAEMVEKEMAEIQPLLTRPEAKEALGRIRTQLSAWRQVYSELAQLCATDRPDEAFKLAFEKTVPISDSIEKDATLLRQIQGDNLAKDRAAASDEFSRSRWITFIVVGLALAAAGVTLGIVWRSSARLRQMASELSQGAAQVAGAAGQVASASQALAQGASEQAASLEETSSSSEEISSMTLRNAENTNSAAVLMVESAEIIEEANSKLRDMVQSMNDITTSSDKISKIIKVIDEIAFQTNILALNAAVEAARAGEAGMGFAVVADEVRNLAQRSAQAAKDTATLIEESIANSSHGRTRLDDVAKSINAITASARKVKELVDEVNVSSQEQTRGIEQVTRAVAQMQEVTQKTAANAEESAAAAEELSAQAGATQSVVGRLNALVGSDRGASATLGSSERRPMKAFRPEDNHGLAALAGAVGSKQRAERVGAAGLSGEALVTTATAFHLDESE